MRVNFLLLCNFASQLVNGGPIIAGVFRGVRTESFPAQLEPFFLATEIEADPHEMGRQLFEVRMIDEDGAVMYQNVIESEFERRPDFLPSYMYFCGQVFVEKPILRAGVYRFDLVWNEETLAQARLEISN